MKSIQHPYWLTPLIVSVICAGWPLGPALGAETLFLRDGSVLIGQISEGTSHDYLVSNPRYGIVSVLQTDVVYRQSLEADVHNETIVIRADGLAVVASRRHDVPKRMEDKDKFNLLVTGQVKSVTDPNGTDVPFETQAVGDNSLVSIAYGALAQQVAYVTVTTLEQGALEPVASGLWSLQLHTIPAQDELLRVIVRYPKTFRPRQVTPDPALEADGLIVWEQNLRRQQQFTPEILFAL